ncbi:MAG: MFS transporter [Betaproteobacteria bacterium]|nr:MFS transporter [Betaproteobacteria bacterium]
MNLLARANALSVVVTVTATQMVGAMSNAALPVIAPRLAEALGVSAALIGYQVSVLFGAACIGTLFGGAFVQRFGACRTTQISIGLCGAGLLFMTVSDIAAIALGSLVAGFGQGLINSAAAHLLVRYTSADRRNLIFSVKQSGVPVGGMAIALTAPAIAVSIGWQWALVMVAALAALLVALIQPARGAWDADRDPAAGLRQRHFGGLALVWSRPSLRWLVLAGFFFSAIQRSLITFTVVFLVAEAGYGLIAAGIMLSVTQAGGVMGRLAWGWIADRTRSSLGVLLVICVITMSASVLLVLMTADWPQPAVYALFLVFGAVSVGWNGVLHAECARLSPPGMVGAIAGGSTFFIFGGVLTGPAVFAAAYGVIGSYAATFNLLVVFGAAGFVLLLLAKHAARPRAAEDRERLHPAR